VGAWRFGARGPSPVRAADRSLGTVPVVLFDEPEQVSQWVTGQELLAIGRLRRRFFRIGGATQSRTEMVAEQVLPLEQKASVCTALVQVGRTIAGVLEDLFPQEQ
jgi:hypothetical protein